MDRARQEVVQPHHPGRRRLRRQRWVLHRAVHRGEQRPTGSHHERGESSLRGGGRKGAKGAAGPHPEVSAGRAEMT